ncbi:hypothetical protein TanjilG_28982 [Lupinus angustifolius]|uniref:Uncharacterized protein n=1 Tax=Lupinus angustifolius TaxID=3871 RepID=A0A4P1RTQ0_LUPAN|nr:PREDICTED: uncharacterized protein LOC109363669 [Lupinus angustifolius]OIW17632.1 hypothetical protein TanjilG_28982 [Lupinus angustifolius]
MRCKKHLHDLTSNIGVCASCLRERLEPIFQAQAQAQQHARVTPRSSDDLKNNHCDNSVGLNFPRSVSPYVPRRKTDHDRRFNRSFYSTPLVDPSFSESCDGGKTTSSKKIGKLWNLSNLFQSRSNKSCDDPSSSVAASTSSPSWLSTILSPHRHNKQRNCEESSRGNSTENKFYNDVDHSPLENHTAAVAARRSRLGSAGKKLSGMVICLSPLVRASPNRNTPMVMVSGTHTSYCANRSRKFADFGRVTHNR